MENTKNQDTEFSFATVLKLFKGKLKLVVIIALVAAILGGALGAATVLVKEKNYENTLTFYLPTSEKSDYASAIPLLESELFLEKILIDTKVEKYEGEQIRVPDLPFSEEDKEQYKKLSLEIKEAQESITELKRYFPNAQFVLSELEKELSRKSSSYTAAANVFQSYTSPQIDGVIENIKDYKTELNDALTALKTAATDKKLAEDEYNAFFDEYQNNKKELHNAELTLEDSSEALDQLLAPYYEEWKRDLENENMLYTAKEGIKFALSKEELFPDKYNSTLTEEENKEIPKHFLYVNVEISADEELANRIVQNICTELGDFVVLNTTPKESYDTIKASCLSVPNVNESAPASLIPNTVKYAAFTAILAEVLLIAIVLFIYYKRKYVDETPVAQSASASEKIEDSIKADELSGTTEESESTNETND